MKLDEEKPGTIFSLKDQLFNQERVQYLAGLFVRVTSCLMRGICAGRHAKSAGIRIEGTHCSYCEYAGGSPSGDWMLTRSQPTKPWRLWSVLNDVAASVGLSPTEPLNRVEFSSDSRSLIATKNTGCLSVWRLGSDRKANYSLNQQGLAQDCVNVHQRVASRCEAG